MFTSIFSAKLPCPHPVNLDIHIVNPPKILYFDIESSLIFDDEGEGNDMILNL